MNGSFTTQFDRLMSDFISAVFALFGISFSEKMAPAFIGYGVLVLVAVVIYSSSQNFDMLARVAAGGGCGLIGCAFAPVEVRVVAFVLLTLAVVFLLSAIFGDWEGGYFNLVFLLVLIGVILLVSYFCLILGSTFLMPYINWLIQILGGNFTPFPGAPFPTIK